MGAEILPLRDSHETSRHETKKLRSAGASTVSVLVIFMLQHPALGRSRTGISIPSIYWVKRMSTPTSQSS
ncbi:hypothetical protein CBS147321_1425 [Aspergillus niger]|nr:hypothetical protein CBS11232_3602 [Aspergillus niger]KAI2881311.1 hypothetical protein CBS115988_639 [Aspergillus niger]KAI2906716.1 hypothetical protein CBS147371_11059 [Aspergillus niger]KAI2909133.1 hypothetical protein CBS11852_257 [Aspergillus niger]KAI2933718.1 hypothetical protein CBS147320_1574 [Aspergillus niger]